MNSFWQIQNCRKNYPPERQKQANASLLEKYGVNPAYMKGKSEMQFVREAEPIKRAVKEDAVKTNFANKNTKQALLDELAAAKDTIQKQAGRIVELEAQLEHAAEPSINYNKPDSNPDKS